MVKIIFIGLLALGAWAWLGKQPEISRKPSTDIHQSQSEEKVPEAKAEGWIPTMDKDELDGKETRYWVLNSSNVVDLPFFSGGPQRARLILQFLGSGPEMLVGLILPTARFDTDFSGDGLRTSLRIRYDDNPAEELSFSVEQFGSHRVSLGKDMPDDLRIYRRVRIETKLSGIDPVTAIFDFHPDKFPVAMTDPDILLTEPQSKACEAVKKEILITLAAPASTRFSGCSVYDGSYIAPYRVYVTAKIPHWDGSFYHTTYHYSGSVDLNATEPKVFGLHDR
jgi:hypothetical protein